MMLARMLVLDADLLMLMPKRDADDAVRDDLMRVRVKAMKADGTTTMMTRVIGRTARGSQNPRTCLCLWADGATRSLENAHETTAMTATKTMTATTKAST